MKNPTDTTNSPTTPHANQATLNRALLLERFGGLNSSSALDSESHGATREPVTSQSIRRPRRRYRGWSLASGRRR